MITFFHTADIHFGVENYGKIDPKTGIHTRLLDFKKSLETCVDQAIEQDVDFFLFSGDAYKTAYPTPTQQKLLMEILFKLHIAKIPVVIVVGNHDHPLSFGKATALDVFGQLPLDGFHVFSKPDILNLNTKNGLVQIVGIPWPTRNNLVAKDDHKLKSTEEITSYISEKVSQIISHLASNLDPNLPAVLAGHLTVSDGVFSGSEKRAVYGSDPLFLPSELALPIFDYVALGHLHRYQNLNPNGYPAVVYSGSIDRVDFGERKEVKGFCKVKIEQNCPPKRTDLHRYMTKATHEFIELETRPFIQIELVLNNETDQTLQIINEIKKYNIKDAILKIVYHVPAGISEKIDLNSVQRVCTDAIYLVGVIPKKDTIARTVRTNFNVEISSEILLETYIESKSELKKIKSQLMQKAKLIQEEVDNQNCTE